MRAAVTPRPPPLPFALSLTHALPRFSHFFFKERIQTARRATHTPVAGGGGKGKKREREGGSLKTPRRVLFARPSPSRPAQLPLSPVPRPPHAKTGRRARAGRGGGGMRRAREGERGRSRDTVCGSGKTQQRIYFSSRARARGLVRRRRRGQPRACQGKGRKQEGESAGETGGAGEKGRGGCGASRPGGSVSLCGGWVAPLSSFARAARPDQNTHKSRPRFVNYRPATLKVQKNGGFKGGKKEHTRKKSTKKLIIGKGRKMEKKERSADVSLFFWPRPRRQGSFVTSLVSAVASTAVPSLLFYFSGRSTRHTDGEGGGVGG